MDDAGLTTPVRASVPGDPTATCWRGITPDGGAAPTPSAGWANVSECTIDADGVRPLGGDGTDGRPTWLPPTSTCPTVTVASMW